MVNQKENIKKIAVVGMGVIGSLVALMLRLYGYEVVGIDTQRVKSTIPIKRGDVADKDFLSASLDECDAVISCLPYHLTRFVVEEAFERGIHYLDATEDTQMTSYIKDRSKNAKGVMIPQCGLAPGFIGIVASHLAQGFKTIDTIKMRVGALPQNPSGKLGYAVNWSIEGLVNEYIEECDIIKEGKIQKVSPMTMLETLRIDGTEYEAFTTSGGLGTMAETYKDKVKNLDYKSIRYPGHCKMMKFLLDDLKMKDKRWELMKILQNALPPCEQDKVLVYASVTGEVNDKIQTVEFVKEYGPKVINGMSYKAIAWTTAAAMVSTLELVDKGHLPQRGFISQEDIPFDKLQWTEYGKLFSEEEK
tara:strand:- start:430 stop:1512 length:1083 start_codon:yes stop_codon:yes gene_type:complete